MDNNQNTTETVVTETAAPVTPNNSVAAAAPAATVNADRRLDYLTMAVIALIVLLLLGGGAYFFFLRPSSHQNVATPTPTVTSTVAATVTPTAIVTSTATATPTAKPKPTTQSYIYKLSNKVGVNLTSKFKAGASLDSEVEIMTKDVAQCLSMRITAINTTQSLEQYVNGYFEDSTAVKDHSVPGKFKLFGENALTISSMGLGNKYYVFQQVDSKTVLQIEVNEFVPEGGGDDTYATCQATYKDSDIQAQLDQIAKL
jgi:hypothetical protein